MNVAMFRGRLGKDAEVRAAGEKAIAINFRLAVDENRYVKGREKKTNWVPVTVFASNESRLPEFLKKGKDVLLKNGEYQTSSYEKDGKTIYTHDFVFNARDVELLGGGETDKGREAAFEEPKRASEEAFQALTDDIPF